MSSQPDPKQLSVEEFTARCRDALIPVSNRFSYFQTSPLSEEDVREYVEEPVAALPLELTAILPPIIVAPKPEASACKKARADISEPPGMGEERFPKILLGVPLRLFQPTTCASMLRDCSACQ